MSAAADQTQLEQVLPDYAKVVMVPLANPQTAPDLLRLAAEVVEPDNGRILALIVTMGDPDKETQAVDAMQPICESLSAKHGWPISLVTVIATSVARGILDAARENGADLVVLGAHKPVRGQVVLGTVVEGVLAASPCDVMIYRMAQEMDFDRVVVPIDTYSHAKVAARMGIWLARRKQVPMDAIYVRRPGQSQFEAWSYLQGAFYNLPGEKEVKRHVIQGHNQAQAIIARVDDNDLIVVGFDGRPELERWLFGGVSRDLVDRAPGPVILVSRSQSSQPVPVRMGQRLITWLRPTLTRAEQEDIIRQAQENASFTLDYAVLIVISALIASLGLLLNSSAVIIGAMLVAPLMQPIIAFATGLATARITLMRRSLATLLAGVGLALVVGFGIGALSTLLTPTDEMLGRGSPSLLDAAVALASGFIGAYATARKDIPAALAGVAIAAALMPPLCTVGLGFAIGDRALALGAGLLFVTNILSIALAGTGVFVWLGMSLRVPAGERRRQIQALAVLVALVGVISLELVAINNRVSDESLATEILAEVFSSSELVSVTFLPGEETRVLATLMLSSGAVVPSDYSAAHQRLELELQRDISLEVVPVRVVRIDTSAPLTPTPEADQPTPIATQLPPTVVPGEAP